MHWVTSLPTVINSEIHSHSDLNLHSVKVRVIQRQMVINLRLGLNLDSHWHLARANYWGSNLETPKLMDSVRHLEIKMETLKLREIKTGSH